IRAERLGNAVEVHADQVMSKRFLMKQQTPKARHRSSTSIGTRFACNISFRSTAPFMKTVLKRSAGESQLHCWPEKNTPGTFSPTAPHRQRRTFGRVPMKSLRQCGRL